MSEEERTNLLIALTKPHSDAEHAALLERFCRGVKVWHTSSWDPTWRRAARKATVAKLVADATAIAAPDFDARKHIPREAGEQLPGLPWPRDRTDFLAFPMLGYVLARSCQPATSGSGPI